MQKIAEKHRYSHVDDLYAAIGYGGVKMSRIIPGIKDEYNRNYKETRDEQPADNTAIDANKESSKSSGSVIVEGIDNCLINMAKCCNPLPGEPIIGFITRGHGLTIHRRDCKNVPVDIELSPEPERWIMASWNKNVKVEARSTLNIYSINRDGLLLDVTTAIMNAHVKMQAVNARTLNDGNCIITLTITVNGKEHLDSIIKFLYKINGVFLIERSET